MNELGLFAKHWRPGAVKTRLAAEIGAVPASEVYRAFVEALLQRCSRLADRRVLAVWPPESEREFRQLATGQWQVTRQSDGDLGQRMFAYFSQAFEGGAQRVVLIGSDSPTLPIEFVDQAFRLLHDASIVIGPSDDGGYYLVGAAGEVPPIFDGIAWSQPTVWEQTIERVAESGRSFAELPAWYDVDHLDDLRRLRRELHDMNDREPAYDKLLQSVETALSGESR